MKGKGKERRNGGETEEENKLNVTSLSFVVHAKQQWNFSHNSCRFKFCLKKYARLPIITWHMHTNM